VTQNSFFERVGGSVVFEKLAREFYRGVSQDDLLKPMYPESDLGPAERRLRMFLEQYWGGPTTYQEERGHPRLRLRHAPFKIGPEARARWLGHMASAVATLDLSPLDRDELWDYLERAATAMLNSFEN
jgi:hemoglobin